MARCLFCDIASGAVGCDQVHADEELLAFRDINPQAPVHVLVIPRQHVTGLASLSDKDSPWVGRLITQATILASKLGIAGQGYRFVINQGDDGGQTVNHLHLHLLGGRSLGWPPG